eukprot:11663912-Alexandrium_andersonii.AAC.1
MSASLVGSEMCIRDSRRFSWALKAGMTMMNRSSASGASSSSPSRCGAVSYTHLTLPTICSV